MVVDRAMARGKDVGNLFVSLALNHLMKNLAFSRREAYLLQIVRCRNRAGRCLPQFGERFAEAKRSGWPLIPNPLRAFAFVPPSRTSAR